MQEHTSNFNPVLIIGAAIVVIVGALVVFPPKQLTPLYGDAGPADAGAAMALIHGAVEEIDQQKACHDLEIILCDKLVECAVVGSDQECVGLLDQEDFCSDIKNSAAEIEACMTDTAALTCEGNDLPASCARLH